MHKHQGELGRAIRRSQQRAVKPLAIESFEGADFSLVAHGKTDAQ